MLRFDYDHLDSTHEQAKRLMNERPGEALLVTAATQSDGRGRSGRTWQSPRGGAWFSVVWPIERWDERYTASTLAAGWAVLGAIEPLLSPERSIQVKWPNDLLIDGEKVAGVLCERIAPLPHQAGQAATALLIGVGINANIGREQLGEPMRLPATTLRAATGRETNLAWLIERCTTMLGQAMTSIEREDMPGDVIRAVEDRLAWRNQTVTLRTGAGVVTGVCRGLDSVGRLLLEIDGQHVPFAGGEVEHVRTVAESASV